LQPRARARGRAHARAGAGARASGRSNATIAPRGELPRRSRSDHGVQSLRPLGSRGDRTTLENPRDPAHGTETLHTVPGCNRCARALESGSRCNRCVPRPRGGESGSRCNRCALEAADAPSTPRHLERGRATPRRRLRATPRSDPLRAVIGDPLPGRNHCGPGAKPADHGPGGGAQHWQGTRTGAPLDRLRDAAQRRGSETRLKDGRDPPGSRRPEARSHRRSAIIAPRVANAEQHKRRGDPRSPLTPRSRNRCAPVSSPPARANVSRPSGASARLPP
jgi:hypothetical protein